MVNNKTNNNILELLFNPFKKIAGVHALLIGFAFVTLASVFSYHFNTHFNGVIDIKYGESELPFQGFLLYSIINVISISLVLYITGIIISKSRIRLIDVIGTQTLARYPLVIAPFFNTSGLIERVTNNIMHKYLNYGEPEPISNLEIILFVFFIILTLIIIVWFISLMFNAYRVSCNLKGNTAVISFIIGLIIAEVISLILNSVIIKALLIT